MKAQNLIKTPFAFVARFVPLFLSLMNPNTSTAHEISQAKQQQQMEILKHYLEGPTPVPIVQFLPCTEEEEERTRPMSTEVNQQQIKDETAKWKVSVDLASLEISIGFGAMITTFFSRQDPLESLHLAIFCFLAFVTLFTGFGLLLYSLFMLTRKPTLITQTELTTSKVLISISIISLILTIVTPVTLLPKPYDTYIISIVVAVVLVALGFYIWLGTRTNNEKETEEKKTSFNEHVKALISLSELNLGLASLSCSGLIGILFGSWTNALNHADHPYVKVSEICTFVCFISSVLLVILGQVRVDGLTSKARVNLIKSIKTVCVFLFIMIAMTALAVSSYFLKWYILAVLLPVLLAGIVGFITTANDKDCGDYPDEELKFVFAIASKVMTSLPFGIIMAIFGAYLGSEESNMHLTIPIFFSICAFVSGIILMLLSYEAPKKPASMRVIFRVLTLCGINFFASGALSVSILVLMRL